MTKKTTFTLVVFLCEQPIDFINKAHEAYEKAREKGGDSIVFA